MPEIRVLVGAMLLAYLAVPSAALAGGYTISYALEAGGVRDWGKAACQHETACKIESRRTKVSISIAFRESNHRKIFIRVASEDDSLECCFFESGVDEAQSDVGVSLIRFRLYAKRRSRTEFFLNQPYGIAYIQFLDMK